VSQKDLKQFAFFVSHRGFWANLLLREGGLSFLSLVYAVDPKDDQFPLVGV